MEHLHDSPHPTCLLTISFYHALTSFQTTWARNNGSFQGTTFFIQSFFASISYPITLSELNTYQYQNIKK